MKVKFLIANSILAGISASLLSGCVPVAVMGAVGGTTKIATSVAEERGLGGVISDAELKHKVTSRLDELNPEAESKIKIIVHQGRVLLIGTVPTEKMQIDAVRATWEVSGVREVLDKTHVGPEMTVGQVAKDTWITTQLDTKLLVENNVSSINYDAHTHNGIVYLMGIAQNQQELDQVLNVIRHIDGVKEVVSYVVLKDQPISYSAPHAPATGSHSSQQRPYSSPNSIHHPNTGSSFN